MSASLKAPAENPTVYPLVFMCRNIKRLRRPDASPTEQELHDAALQFVRKISGMRAPSRVNSAAFEAAVEQVAEASRALFQSLESQKPARASA